MKTFLVLLLIGSLILSGCLVEQEGNMSSERVAELEKYYEDNDLDKRISMATFTITSFRVLDANGEWEELKGNIFFIEEVDPQ